jgi:hypothetical protein
MSIDPLKEPALLERRKRSYIWLLVIMILSYVSLGPFTTLMPITSPWPMITSGMTVAAWYLLAFWVTYNRYSSMVVRVLYGALLIFQMMFNGYVTFQSDLIPVAELIVPASIAYIANIIGFGVVFYILLQDIFSQKHDLAYGLLGASNIYFLIPILFSYVYCLVSVHHPEFIGADPASLETVLLNCFYYSWHVIASIDYPGQVAAPIQQIAVLESIAGNLFVVFIIGRLMVK